MDCIAIFTRSSVLIVSRKILMKINKAGAEWRTAISMDHALGRIDMAEHTIKSQLSHSNVSPTHAVGCVHCRNPVNVITSLLYFVDGEYAAGLRWRSACV